MNRRKQVLTVVLLFLFSFLLAGCSLFVKPEEIVEEEMERIKELDGETIARYVSYDDLFDFDSEEELSDDTKDVFDIILKEFDYEILNAEKLKKEATVTVKITAIDMTDVVKDYMKYTLQYVMLNEISDEEELGINELFAILKDILEDDYKLTSHEVDIDLIKEDGEWNIIPNDDISMALTGHFSEIAGDPYLLTAQETAEVTLDTIKSMDDLMIYRFLIPGNILSDDGSAEAILCKKIAENFDYKITAAETEDDTAIISTEITNIDLKSILPRYEELLTEYAKEYGGVMPSEEEISHAAQQCFAQALEESEEMKIYEIDITFTNDGSLWTLDSNEDFVDAMRGGLKAFEKALIEMNETE